MAKLALSALLVGAAFWVFGVEHSGTARAQDQEPLLPEPPDEPTVLPEVAVGFPGPEASEAERAQALELNRRVLELMRRDAQRLRQLAPGEAGVTLELFEYVTLEVESALEPDAP